MVVAGVWPQDGQVCVLVAEGVLAFPEGTSSEVVVQGHQATGPQLGILSAGVTGWGHRTTILVIGTLLPVGDSFQRMSPRIQGWGGRRGGRGFRIVLMTALHAP